MDEKTTTWGRKGSPPPPMAVSSLHSIHPSTHPPIHSSTHPLIQPSTHPTIHSSSHPFIQPRERAEPLVSRVLLPAIAVATAGRGHPSGAGVSAGLELPTRESRRGGPPQAPILGIAPSGVCQADASPRRWWALTPPFHLCRHPPSPEAMADTGPCVFCGTVPSLAAGGRYPPLCPVELGLSSGRGEHGPRPRPRLCSQPR